MRSARFLYAERMSYAYQFQGGASLQSIPGAALTSGIPTIEQQINTAYTLTLKTSADFELTSDSPVTVPLPGPSAESGTPQANILQITVQGPRVKATITTADGASQVVPVDPTLYMETTTVSPITALTLTRTPGVDTLASVFLGQI